MKTLFHISRKWQEEISVFTPRVPLSPASTENRTQLRICTSSSLEGCVQGHPDLMYYMFDYPHMEYYDFYEDTSQLWQLDNHEKRLGYLVKVYEFQVSESDVVTPDTLLQNNWVPDATKSQEHWITTTISPIRTFYALIQPNEERLEEENFTVYTCEEHALGNVRNGMEIPRVSA